MRTPSYSPVDYWGLMCILLLVLGMLLASCTKEPLMVPTSQENVESVADTCSCGKVRGFYWSSCGTDPEDNWLRVENNCSANVDTFYVSADEVLAHPVWSQWCNPTGEDW